ncbi:MAG: tetratricopeptide (TPR) repeat protein [Crocinitomicaceae bacterium]|jgi:tetratricopeptide (TPR) repeat protein
MFANKTHEEAHALLTEGKIEDALLAYTKALEQNPEHADIYSDRGVAYLHLKDEKRCFEDLNKALELQPDYSYRYAARAFAKNNFGDLNGAIKDYEKAVELDPDDAIGHNNLGLLLEQRGYKKEAEERFKRADNLSKMEDHLLDVMDDLETPYVTSIEQKKPADEVEQVNKTEQVNPVRAEIDPTIKREKEISAVKEMGRIFTSRKQFNDFMKFIKNGFKIK